MNRVFARSEYEARLVRIREAMEQAGIDVLFASDPCNMNYATGYNIQGLGNHQLVVITLEDSQPHWFGRYMDARAAMLQTDLDEDHIHSYQDVYVDSPSAHVFNLLSDLTRAKNWDKKRIGVEKSCLYLPVSAYEVLVSRLPNTVIVDASGLINWVRTVKSAAEIDYIRQAGVLSDLGMQAGLDGVRTGRRQCDVAAEITYAMAKGTNEFGGFAMELPLMPTGDIFARTYHASWTDEPYLPDTATGENAGAIIPH